MHMVDNKVVYKGPKVWPSAQLTMAELSKNTVDYLLLVLEKIQEDVADIKCEVSKLSGG